MKTKYKVVPLLTKPDYSKEVGYGGVRSGYAIYNDLVDSIMMYPYESKPFKGSSPLTEETILRAADIVMKRTPTYLKHYKIKPEEI